ncbi:unnamed protein product [Rangifer tarandus platyrhynchus]|uniref:Uncharacterized protein n=1 Tax=Rangifer tarandus platyrhynchus TaxID=3082113 RepID=A0AC59ZQ81_RANTA
MSLLSGENVKMQIPRPTPLVADCVGQGWARGICLATWLPAFCSQTQQMENSIPGEAEEFGWESRRPGAKLREALFDFVLLHHHSYSLVRRNREGKVREQ